MLLSLFSSLSSPLSFLLLSFFSFFRPGAREGGGFGALAAAWRASRAAKAAVRSSRAVGAAGSFVSASVPSSRTWNEKFAVHWCSRHTTQETRPKVSL